MTAPHFHTSTEVKTAIKNIGHNDRTATEGATEGAPTGIKGGSAANKTTMEKGVSSNQKGQDWVSHRPIKNKS